MNLRAVYRHGLFEPLEPVSLDEEQRVRLNIEIIPEETLHAWFQRVREVQSAIVKRRGPLPDSTIDIATDRAR